MGFFLIELSDEEDDSEVSSLRSGDICQGRQAAGQGASVGARVEGLTRVGNATRKGKAA